MTPAEFRALFPALERRVWLDTPGAPPGAQPVLEALRTTVDEWAAGDFAWAEWDQAADLARLEFAAYAGVPADHVSSLGSLSEALSTVLSAFDGGTVVVAADEFRSVLFPVLGRGRTSGITVRVVERTPGATRTEDLLRAIDESTVLVAASEVITRDGERVDLETLTAAAHSVGARMFANLTQTMGVLHRDLSTLTADYKAAHGYKWMLCPRGAAWLVADPATLAAPPLAPSWKTSGPPEQFFGGAYREASNATRWNTSPAWFSWIGARAALNLLAQLPPTVEIHCLDLAQQFCTHATQLGFAPRGTGSHIVTVDPPPGVTITPELLAEHRIKATTNDGGLRVGFHYFNNSADVDAILNVLRRAQSA
ncbi:aminotransferase class V-fold PLP-dependent enzyme [Nocardia panacis]|uniref:Aminotransferase class V-fold PLP-dependent enzyme n=1 Tax=Nocardia panacis TaxID=2340916 RepID=A0A3A4K1T8_9NOCA|nr:aminotransferase class V-fold PLP-dependent enzyme [Nocardia panacis]RJO70097.1 aminotransferase class V-fold PLP-dependent enzyme [Nocardia panacis]